MRTQTEQSKTGAAEHILVCLSSSPSNARIVHTAARMAKALGARFTAIYVQTDTVINDEVPLETVRDLHRLVSSIRTGREKAIRSSMILMKMN